MKINVMVKKKDRKKYLLLEKRDYEILGKIYKLEKQKLSREDKKIINFIRTQLEKDWRKPLLVFLNGLSRKYK